MKKVVLIIIVMVAACMPFSAFSKDEATIPSGNSIDHNFIGLDQVCYQATIDLDKSYNDHQPELMRRGCCSHHGGVCGCDSSSNKIECCDGTLSPSCTCSGY